MKALFWFAVVILASWWMLIQTAGCLGLNMGR